MAWKDSLTGIGSTVKSWPGRIRQYLREVWAELQKVSWPLRNEVVSTTIVVIVTVFLFGFYLWIVDIALSWGVDQLFKRFGAS